MAEQITINQIGNVVDIVLCTLPEPGDTDRAQRDKRRSTSLAQQARNDKNAAGRMAFIALGNFTGSDYYATCSYDDEHLPENIAAVKKHAASLRRRLKYRWNKTDEILKYIRVIEGLESGKRYHHHWMINRPPGWSADDMRKFLKKAWPYGSAHVEMIHGNSDRSAYDLSLYFYKEVKVFGRPAGTRGFTCSQNLNRGLPLSGEVPDGTVIAIPPGIPTGNILIQDVQQLIYSRYIHLRYIQPAGQAFGPIPGLRELGLGEAITL